jgi:site-specific DNA-methyltransferase (adenine-specific)
VEITGYKDKHEYINKNGITSVVYLMDCMDLLKQIPEKYFELAIVDPPYGLDSKSIRGAGKLKDRIICNVEVGIWNIRPKKEYFEKLFEVSKNQIIWGGNYFQLPPTRGFIIWDKKQPENISFASCEFAWTSFDRSAKTFYYSALKENDNRIHATQKPVALYKWLLQNYAKEGDTILDTHFGSLSIGIACHDMGFELTAIELDEYYYEAGKNRLINHQRQLNLF